MTSSRLVLGTAVFCTVGLMAGAGGDGGLAVAARLVGNLTVPALWAAAVLSRSPRLASKLAGLGLTPWCCCWRSAAGATGAIGQLLHPGGCGGRLGVDATVAGAADPGPRGVGAGAGDRPGTGRQPGGSHGGAQRREPAGVRRHGDAGRDLSEADRQAALAEFDELAERMLAWQRRFWPSLVVIGLVSQAAPGPGPGLGAGAAGHGPAAAAVGAPVGRMASAVHQRLDADRRPRGGRQRGSVPGDDRLESGPAAGLLLAVQGLAVQTWLVRRVLPPVVRVMFWVVGALFLAPALMGGGVLIGLADQWMDLRRDRAVAPDSDDET